MSTHTADAVRGLDRVRQVSVLLGGVLMIVAAAWGAGAFGGTPIAEAANGAFAADASVLAPAATAFSIWLLIYAGVIVFGVYQAIPRNGSDPRLRSVGWWMLASAALNAIWILAIQAELVWLSLVVIIGLLIALLRTAALLRQREPHSWKALVTTDVPVGLYLGWTTIAVLANVGALVAYEQPHLERTAPAVMGGAVAALVVLAVAIFVFARWARKVPGVAVPAGLAMSWGLLWIAIGRAEGEPKSLAMMWAAGLVAIVAFAVPIAVMDFRLSRAPAY